MNVLVFIELRLYAQHYCPAANTAQRRLSGFLHHVAQVSGELQLSGALADDDLHFQNFTAGLRPGQTVDHADLLPLRVKSGGIGLAVQELGQLLFCYRDSLRLAGDQLHIRLSAQGRHPPLQQTDAGLPGIIPDNGPEHAVVHPKGGLFQTMLRQLLGQQVPAGDFHLFLVGVAGKANHLHPVQQRLGNGIGGVGCCDKHDLAQVHRNLHIVVPEGVVLLTVQHLQQSGGRVSPVIIAQLVDLVQQQQRIHGPAPDDGVNHPAGHGTDVGPAVSPDIRLIPDATQGEAGQLPVQRLGNADGNGGLAHSRRAHEAENLSLALGIHLPDGDGFQNTLLHLFQAEVVLLQHLPGGFHADPFPGRLVPGHLQAHI